MTDAKTISEQYFTNSSARFTPLSARRATADAAARLIESSARRTPAWRVGVAVRDLSRLAFQGQKAPERFESELLEATALLD